LIDQWREFNVPFKEVHFTFIAARTILFTALNIRTDSPLVWSKTKSRKGPDNDRFAAAYLVELWSVDKMVVIATGASVSAGPERRISYFSGWTTGKVDRCTWRRWIT
jgi:hypothetical protein